MRPPAYIVHRLASRTRLRMPDLSGDHERCGVVVDALSHCPEVVAVRANPVTASILLEHDDEAFDRIAAYARDLDLFESGAAAASCAGESAGGRHGARAGSR